MKKVLIALESSFTNETYQENFFNEGFQVATTTSGEKAWDILSKAPPDAVIVDANLPEINAFEMIRRARENENTRLVPIIVYSRTGSNEHREKAMDYEAKDFIVGLSDSPRDVALKVKSHLGQQKAYVLDICSDEDAATEITRDLGYGGGTKCPSCSKNLSIHLLRNLNLGKNTFKVSLICTGCSFRHGAKKE